MNVSLWFSFGLFFGRIKTCPAWVCLWEPPLQPVRICLVRAEIPCVLHTISGFVSSALYGKHSFDPFVVQNVTSSPHNHAHKTVTFSLFVLKLKKRLFSPLCFITAWPHLGEKKTDRATKGQNLIQLIMNQTLQKVQEVRKRIYFLYKKREEKRENEERRQNRRQRAENHKVAAAI